MRLGKLEQVTVCGLFTGLDPTWKRGNIQFIDEKLPGEIGQTFENE